MTNHHLLDMEKAYDKAWLSAILYTLWQNGIKGKIWRLIKKLNMNVAAQVKKRFGLTSQDNSDKKHNKARQSSVLSMTEYAKLVDKLTIELEQNDQELYTVLI